MYTKIILYLWEQHEIDAGQGLGVLVRLIDLLLFNTVQMDAFYIN
jgi:hypothetical protein